MEEGTQVQLDDYLTLFAPYDAQLREFLSSEREYGGRFALLFRQVTRMLVLDAKINTLMPRLYLSMAHRYLDKEPDVVRYFSYEDNRHFFLTELREWLAVHERGRALRQAGRD